MSFTGKLIQIENKNFLKNFVELLSQYDSTAIGDIFSLIIYTAMKQI